MSVTPRGMAIQEAYKEYRNQNFRVNRRYQRKLVWTKDEKRALVDSILHGYPIPLILLAYESRPDGTKSYEILDGMQRLNAIFTFVENDFDLNNLYFDVEQLSRAKQLAEAGKIQRISDPSRLLSPGECASILEYTLAVTEFPSTDEDAVNEVFGRINSFGRRLSDQEKRQAGVVSLFSQCVSEIATEIRGDVSQETLDLAEMPTISIDVSGESPEYGIKADETFWCKQGILRRSQLRDSEDEQMVADLVISIIEGAPFGFSGSNLDEYYNPGSDNYREIDEKIVSYGVSKLKTDIIGVLSILRETIESYDPSTNALRKIAHPSAGSNPIKTAFFAVFNAFFELCVKQRKSPNNSSDIMQALQNLQSRLNVAAGQIRSDARKQNVDVTLGLIQRHFSDREPPVLEHGIGSAIPLENTIRRSRVETSAYECKQGLLRLGPTRDLDEGLLDRIIQTICAIVNIGPGREGAIFIGVADTESDMRRVSELDGVHAAHIGSRFVVGVDREAKCLGETLDGYKSRIVQRISQSGLSEPHKSTILSRLDCVSYRGHSVICIWIPEFKECANVNDRIFVREGSSTKEVKGAKAIGAVFGLFA